MFTNKTKGIIAVLGASIMWAVEPLFAKISYRTTDFLSTFATRTIFALLVIAVYLFIIDKKLFVLKKRYIPKLIYISLAATLFADLFYIFALTKVPVINAVIIGHMQPIFIILIGFLFLKEDRITGFDYLGIAFMIAAGILVTSRTLGNLLGLKLGTVGDFYVLLSTIAWATTAVVARKYLRQVHAGTIAFYRFLFAGIIFISYMVIKGWIEINNIHQILLGVIIGTGTVLYYEGIKLIKAAQVSALELSTPFFAALLGFVFLQEFLTAMQIIGILFLGGGIYFLSHRE
ncbi:MAG TPA: DMT family transporter [Thermoplasmata archaeon]|nr:DMT family transporter [Thermoplasmata archaeon]